MPLSERAAGEFIGPFWLVFGGCGSAVLAAGFPQLGIGFLGVALAFGLTVLTMAFAIETAFIAQDAGVIGGFLGSRSSRNRSFRT